MIQIRHQHEPVNCQIDYLNERYVIKFNKPIRGVALGQSAVFYKKNICMGGGVISKAF
jgi:tRNA-specific 2-thiouridylase